MVVMGLIQIFKRPFFGWNPFELDSALIGDFPTNRYSFFSCVFAGLAISHTRVYAFGILNNAYWVFQRCHFWPLFKSLHFLSSGSILSNKTVR